MYRACSISSFTALPALYTQPEGLPRAICGQYSMDPKSVMYFAHLETLNACAERTLFFQVMVRRVAGCSVPLIASRYQVTVLCYTSLSYTLF